MTVYRAELHAKIIKRSYQIMQFMYSPFVTSMSKLEDEGDKLPDGSFGTADESMIISCALIVRTAASTTTKNETLLAILS